VILSYFSSVNSPTLLYVSPIPATSSRTSILGPKRSRQAITVEDEVQGLVRLGRWEGRCGWEERVGGRVKYLDTEEVSDEGHESGGCCEADAGGGTSYHDDL
jgi:hypothetical protein